MRFGNRGVFILMCFSQPDWVDFRNVKPGHRTHSCAISCRHHLGEGLAIVVKHEAVRVGHPIHRQARPFGFTPYQQTGCDQRQFADQASFVEAAIWDPATNSFSLYHPLVVNQGDAAGVNFVAPVVPVVPQNAVVAVWFGTNGGSLTLTGAGVQQGGCVNGLNQNGVESIFGQV